MLPSKREGVEVEKAEAYSAGDVYAGPIPTESASPSNTDTSEVSVTSEALPPAMTALSGKHVINGATSRASAEGMMLGLLALASSVWFFLEV